MLNIALFGPPGAGKGTQSEFLTRKYNLFYISTGDLLRKEMAEKTKLGLEAQKSSISMIIEIEVPTLERIQRLDERSQTAGCMPYDNSTAKIVKRLHEHESKTVPVIEKYNQRHEVIKIDGLGTFEEVFARISNRIKSGLKSMR